MNSVEQKIRSFRFGLAAKLYLAIGGAVALTFVASVVAWLSFVELGNQQKKIADTHLPAIVNSLRLAQQSAEIAASAPLLLTTEREADRAEILADLSALQSQIPVILDSLERLFENNQGIAQTERLEAVRRNDVRFAEILRQLADRINRHNKIKWKLMRSVETAVSEHIRLRQALVKELDDQVFYMATGYRSLSQPMPDPKELIISTGSMFERMALSELLEEANLLIAVLTESAIAPRRALLVPLNEQIRASLKASGRALADTGSLETMTAISGGFDRLRTLGTAPESIPALREQMLIELEASRALVLEGRAIAAMIARDVNLIVATVQERTDDSVGRTDASIDLGKQLLLLINVIALLGVVGIAWFYIRRAFTEPVLQLTDTAAEFEKGHFQPEALAVYAERGDELGHLVRTFTRMGQEVQARTIRLDEMVRERTRELNAKTEELEDRLERVAEELRLAEKMQQSILPRRRINNDSIDIYATMHAARDVGGDFYDYMDFRDGTYGFAIGDVSDKGVSAALLMAVSLTRLHGLSYMGHSPTEVITELNQSIAINNDAMMFVTAIFGVIDTNKGALTYVNAGHDAPLLLNHGHEPLALPGTGGMALGVDKDAVYRQQSIQLSKGDTLFVYTDGISEAFNRFGEAYGSGRLRNELTQMMPQSHTARQTCEKIIASVGAFSDGSEQSDDVTCMCIRYLKE